jgi:hypothetical protein
MTLVTASARVDNIRRSLVGLKMPRALEMLDAALRRIEQGQIDGIEAIDDLLAEELSLRESRRIKAALRMARLPIVKNRIARTCCGFSARVAPTIRPTFHGRRSLAAGSYSECPIAFSSSLLATIGQEENKAPHARPL